MKHPYTDQDIRTIHKLTLLATQDLKESSDAMFQRFYGMYPVDPLLTSIAMCNAFGNALLLELRRNRKIAGIETQDQDNDTLFQSVTDAAIWLSGLMNNADPKNSYVVQIVKKGKRVR